MYSEIQEITPLPTDHSEGATICMCVVFVEVCFYLAIKTQV